MEHKTLEELWNEKYQLLLEYYEEHGNIGAPSNYVIKGVRLGRWLHTQRQAYKGIGGWRITEEHIEKLNALGMNWGKSKNTITWDEYYELLKKYYNEHGNINIPKNYTVNGINLGTWINTQRQAYKNHTLSPERIIKLEKLDIRWSKDINHLDWDAYYELLKKYYKKHGNSDVPANYEAEGVKLGAWLTRQRLAYKGKISTKLTEEQILKLIKLNVDWSIKDTQTLNRGIYNMKIYNKILLERLNYVLTDLQREDINEIHSTKEKEELEKQLIKRIWR